MHILIVRTALAAAACLAMAPASADFTRCVAADGTVTFQTKPCAQAQGGTKLAATAEDVERAVSDREASQRRDRCRSAKAIADRQRALLASGIVVDRKAASDELAIQERRMRQDNCGTM
ncbi:MAG TPA: DUF4124 domain-containing protein [Casimicrobiaceae bacterium]|nr:DUF4124 domain-containing protein [Casimicrobiaceae bacterium]